jgi:hypothetical protein
MEIKIVGIDGARKTIQSAMCLNVTMNCSSSKASATKVIRGVSTDSVAKYCISSLISRRSK